MSIMNVETLRFGRVSIDTESILSFDSGVLGFEDLKRFAIILCEGTEPIQWLQAIDDPMVCLAIINPFLIKPDYELDVDDSEMASIGMPSIEDILIVSVMVLPERLQDATINLSAPILINLKNRSGRQIVMEYSPHNAIRYPAFRALADYYIKQEQKEQKHAGVDKKD